MDAAAIPRRIQTKKICLFTHLENIFSLETLYLSRPGNLLAGTDLSVIQISVPIIKSDVIISVGKWYFNPKKE